MESLLAILSFIGGFWWLVSKVTGVKSLIIVLLIKLYAVTAIFLPIIYWLQLAKII